MSALKKDRESYPDTNLITSLYKETEKQVEIINDIRTGDIWNVSSRNRLNDVLDDIMALLSLFFMSIGRNRQSKFLLYIIKGRERSKRANWVTMMILIGPAVYVQLVTVEVSYSVN